MRLFKTLLMLLAVVIAMALTLPSFADTGPVPKTEKIVKATIEKADVQITNINYEASPDVGTAIVYTTEKSSQHFNMEKADAALYVQTLERPCPTLYGYLSQRPHSTMANKIRPPDTPAL